MQHIGIISEFNPLHNGHKYLIDCVKNDFPNHNIIAIMSGNFTQRGDIAIMNKYKRAQAAIECGVDMVVELPLFYAISSGEAFSYGGVSLASSIMNLKHIAFGSEVGEISELYSVADMLYSESLSLKAAIKKHLKEGNSYPKSVSLAFSSLNMPHLAKIIDTPNNMLGVEYIKAIKKLKCDIIPLTYKRMGDQYNDSDIHSLMPSATALREQIYQNNNLSLDKYMPELSYHYAQEVSHTQECLYELISYSLEVNKHSLSELLDYSEGIHNRIIKAQESSYSMQELLNNIKVKRYTMARIKRMLLYSLFNITRDVYKKLLSTPLYYRVLAIKKSKLSIIKDIKSPYIIKGARDAYRAENIKIALDIDKMADRIYSLVSQEKTVCKMIIK